MPVAALIIVCPAIEVKAIEGYSLHADGKIGECGTDFPIEAVLIHAQVPRCIAQADESRRHGIRGRVSELAHTTAFLWLRTWRARCRFGDVCTQRGRAEGLFHDPLIHVSSRDDAAFGAVEAFE